MERSLKLLIAAAVVITAAPLPAFAQAWSTTSVASAPQLTSQPRAPALNLNRTTTTLRPVTLPVRDEQPTVKLKRIDPEDAPQVEVQAKSDWSDDQGLRVSPTRLAYKSRF